MYFSSILYNLEWEAHPDFYKYIIYVIKKFKGCINLCQYYVTILFSIYIQTVTLQTHTIVFITFQRQHHLN